MRYAVIGVAQTVFAGNPHNSNVCEGFNLFIFVQIVIFNTCTLVLYTASEIF